ncbi:MAG: hypothetical protein ABSE79_08020 [Terriglobia bacterium]
MSVRSGYKNVSSVPQERPGTSPLVRFGANAVLATALLPYLSPIVVPDMDVQLMALGTSIGILFVLFLFAPRLFSFGRDDLLILSLGLLSLIYVGPNVAFQDLPATLRACGQIVLAFPVYYVVRNLYRYMSPRVFVGVVALYCAALFLQMRLPSVYGATFAHMLSDTRWYAEEGRGPNGLCTEPSMMGDVCILFVVSLYFFHREYWRTHKNSARFVIAASCVMLLVTGSGTGVVLAVVVALAALLSSRLARSAKIAIVAACLIVMVPMGRLLSTSDSRGASLIASVSDNPFSLLAEYSFAYRVLGAYVGLHEIPHAPFGSWDIHNDPDACDSALSGGLAEHLWPDASFRGLLADSCSLPYDNHGVAALIERMGMAGLVVLAALLLYPRGFHGHWVVRVFLLGLALNASMFIPTLWFVLGCCIAVRRTETASSSMPRPIRSALRTTTRQQVAKGSDDDSSSGRAEYGRKEAAFQQGVTGNPSFPSPLPSTRLS